jgi:hypothetical protein
VGQPLHDFKDGDRVALKWQVNRKGVAPAEMVRKGTVRIGTGGPTTEVRVRMDDTGNMLPLHYTMWRLLDLVELVGEV